MNGSSSRLVGITAWLREFLHPDVIPLVLSYEATIQFDLQRIYAGAVGSGDGEMNWPRGLLLHADELFVVDCHNHRIQVFHQGTGRFLRKWGLIGFNEGEFRFPGVAAIDFRNHLELDGKEPEILISDDYYIHIFRFSDCQFLRRFALQEDGSGFSCGGIVTLGDHIFISRSSPNQIDVLSKGDGRRVRIIGADLVLGPYPGKLLLHDNHDAKALLVADPGKNRVVALDLLSGRFLRQYGLDQQDRPQAVALHGEEVIVCCRSSNRLVVLDRSTTRIRRVISGGLVAGQTCATQFRYPYDLAISSINELFVCDCDNNRVLIFQ